MAVSPGALQSWAKGTPTTAAHPQALQKQGPPGAGGAPLPKKHPLFGGDDEDGEQEGQAEHNEVWAGEKHPDEVTPEDADGVIEWLEQNEPEIHTAVMSYAAAIASGDEQAAEQALQTLQTSTQYLNPEYPPMDEGQKAKAGEQIAKHMRDKGHPQAGSPEHKQAVAIGLSEARSGQEHGSSGASGHGAKGGHTAPGGLGGGAPPGGKPGAMGSKPPMAKPGLGAPHPIFGSLKGP